jgi:hypothetical protein
MKKLFLYLARRDKKGIKLITMINGDKSVNMRLTSLQDLDLPKAWQNQIEKIIYENRMLYEPWIESAESFQDLKDRLRYRGYCQLPLGAISMLNLGGSRKAPVANTSACKSVRTMLRKNDQ